MDSIYWADEKYPSTAFPSFFVIAAYFHVRLIPQNFGRLVSGHFCSALKESFFSSLLRRER
jgi:hypothetical protein